MRVARAEGSRVRLRGAGTKLGWGAPVPEPDVEIRTDGLGAILEHNAPDLTAVVEAGMPLSLAQRAFAQAGQMLAVDPSLGPGDAATVGGDVATADSGPLRHRYGAPRDLLLGITVVLADGTVARSGGKVIKNVAGYDLAKLFCGSFGTLGLIARVAVRLHPLPARRLTAAGSTAHPEVLQRAAVRLAQAPLELESLDAAWADGVGRLMARCAGAVPDPRAGEAARLMEAAGMDTAIESDDDELWTAQRAGQRAIEGAMVRISGLASQLAQVLRAAQRLGASVVGRAATGLLWIRLPPSGTADMVGAIDELRREVAPFPCMVLDASREVRQQVDVWGSSYGPETALMRRVKASFDPAGVCNPGIFVGGI
jgi:glycolate dehydrogenase FAD-binding subunit